MAENNKEEATKRACVVADHIPQIPMYAPYTLQLEPGKSYRWCSCGASKSQPLCDNTHLTILGDDGKPKFAPVVFTAPNTKLSLICGCKYTKAPPFCDGTHSTMPANPTEPPCKLSSSLQW
mmetsp:Transcript_30749/g.34307  ORF Transcript_30749/g.34307 Transcript_30749/m.34307 type:complete len:121 (+) Transcript_30749:73-435(+)